MGRAAVTRETTITTAFGRLVLHDERPSEEVAKRPIFVQFGVNGDGDDDNNDSDGRDSGDSGADCVTKQAEMIRKIRVACVERRNLLADALLDKVLTELSRSAKACFFQTEASVSVKISSAMTIKERRASFVEYINGALQATRDLGPDMFRLGVRSHSLVDVHKTQGSTMIVRGEEDVAPLADLLAKDTNMFDVFFVISWHPPVGAACFASSTSAASASAADAASAETADVTVDVTADVHEEEGEEGDEEEEEDEEEA